MNNKVFLAVLDTAIHNKPVIPVEEGDYSALLAAAWAHNVLPLVFEKLCELPAFADSRAYKDYAVRSMRMVAVQIQRTEKFMTTYRALLDAGICPIVMKGIICRQLYGALGDHRPSGDEDILIRASDFEKVKAVLIKHGYVPEREHMTESQLAQLQETSFHHRDCGLVVEVHTNPIGRESGIRDQMNKCFQNVFDNLMQVELDGITVWTMNDTDHFLFLILHAFKHMMVTGFGIRQIMDILLYYEQKNNRINIRYVLEMLEIVKAKGFFSDIVHLGNEYLGFHFRTVEEKHCVEELLEDLMGNGVFGNATRARQVARTMTNAAVENGGKNNSAKLSQAIFPGRSYLVAGYPQLIEKPWLLPVCWMRRWLKYLRNRRREEGHLAAKSMEISNRKIALLKKYGVL